MSQRSVRLSVACCALLLATATGCGSESEDPGTATDSTSASTIPSDSPDSPDSPTSDSSDSSTGSGGEFVIGETVEPGQAVIVKASNVDGETATRASALVDDKAVEAFLSTTDPRLAADVRGAVKAVDVPAHSTLFGAVVSVGCESPTAITWTQTFDGVEVTPTLPKSNVQCLVPVTSVALFLVPV